MKIKTLIPYTVQNTKRTFKVILIESSLYLSFDGGIYEFKYRNDEMKLNNFHTRRLNKVTQFVRRYVKLYFNEQKKLIFNQRFPP